MPEPTATAEPASPSAAPAPATGAPPADASDALAAAFAAEQPTDSRAARAAPASTDAPPADTSNPYAGLDAKQKRAVWDADPDFQEHARHFARGEMERRDRDARTAEQRADDERRQREALERQDREIDEELTIANDPYHERHDEVNKKLASSALMVKVRDRALRDPQFQQTVKAYIDQVSEQAKVTAVKGAIEQFGDDPDIKVTPEQLAAFRNDPKHDTVPKFAMAVMRASGWLSPREAEAREQAIRADEHTKQLGGWEPRDFAPSEGRVGAPAGGAFDWTQDGVALLERAFRQEEARPNGRAS